MTILERELLGPDGPTDRLDPGVPVRLRVRLRFDAEVDSPQVHFTARRGRRGHRLPDALRAQPGPPLVPSR